MALKERSGRLLASVRGWSPLRIIEVTLRSQSEHWKQPINAPSYVISKLGCGESELFQPTVSDKKLRRKQSADSLKLIYLSASASSRVTHFNSSWSPSTETTHCRELG